MSSDEAIKAIREIRSSRAIETVEQENFVNEYKFRQN
jgi:hypothetical protein